MSIQPRFKVGTMHEMATYGNLRSLKKFEDTHVPYQQKVWEKDVTPTTPAPFITGPESTGPYCSVTCRTIDEALVSSFYL